MHFNIGVYIMRINVCARARVCVGLSSMQVLCMP